MFFSAIPRTLDQTVTRFAAHHLHPSSGTIPAPRIPHPDLPAVCRSGIRNRTGPRDFIPATDMNPPTGIKRSRIMLVDDIGFPHDPVRGPISVDVGGHVFFATPEGLHTDADNAPFYRYRSSDEDVPLQANDCRDMIQWRCLLVIVNWLRAGMRQGLKRLWPAACGARNPPWPP